MALSRHVHPEKLIQDAKDKHHTHTVHSLTGNAPENLCHAYGGRYGTSSIPKYKIPSTVRSWCLLLGTHRLTTQHRGQMRKLPTGPSTTNYLWMAHLSSSNGPIHHRSSPLIQTSSFASFVHTYVPDKAEKLIQENLYKNLIDQDEYPMTRMFS